MKYRGEVVWRRSRGRGGVVISLGVREILGFGEVGGIFFGVLEGVRLLALGFRSWEKWVGLFDIYGVRVFVSIILGIFYGWYFVVFISWGRGRRLREFSVWCDGSSFAVV